LSSVDDKIVWQSIIFNYKRQGYYLVVVEAPNAIEAERILDRDFPINDRTKVKKVKEYITST